MIFQLRGTSGSGKTWVVRQIFNEYDFRPVFDKERKVMGYYSAELNLFVLGKYTVACGGCDTINSQDEICARVHKAVRKGWNVLYEGLIASKLASRYADLYFAYPGIVRFIFLSTPIEQCKANITKRRLEKDPNHPKAHVIPKNVEKDMYGTERSRINLIQAGVHEKHCPLLTSDKAVHYILRKLTNS